MPIMLPICRILMTFVLSCVLEAVDAATALDFAEILRQERAKAMRSQQASNDRMLAFPRTLCAEDAHLLRSAPQNVWYVPEYITREEESKLMAELEGAGDWTNLGRRRLKHFGGVPGAGGDKMVPEELPGFIQDVCKAVHECGVWGDFGEPNQVLLNDYPPGGGIGKHNDGPLFSPKVGILSLSSVATIHFFREDKEGGNDEEEGEGKNVTRGDNNTPPDCSILLLPRSLLIFSEAAYKEYKHCIEPVSHDEISSSLANAALIPPFVFEAKRLPRRRRLSLTVRRVENVMDEASVLETDEARAERRRRRKAFEFGINDLRQVYN